MTTASLYVQLENLNLEKEVRLKSQRERSKRSYQRRFKLSDDMTIEEKMNVLRNIQKRRDSAKRRYTGDVKEKSQERGNLRYKNKVRMNKLAELLELPKSDLSEGQSDLSDGDL